jgi:UDPglucose 6-dehydrogenase
MQEVRLRLTVFGAGYVGLVTGAGLADLGHNVLIVDTNAERIAQLQEGKVPVHEPGLPELIRRNTRGGRLKFGTELTDQFSLSDAYFIAVGTPSMADGAADTSAVFEVASQIAREARQSALVVVKSTVPIGTCTEVQYVIDDYELRNQALEVVSNPEFLKEGTALADFFKPDRVVVGAHTIEAIKTMRALYAPLQLQGENVIATDPRSSELIKYASNTMLAMRISFMNELSRLCHVAKADIHAVRLGVGSDSRIGRKFLYAGPSWGGSCFGKDVRALIQMGRKYDVPMSLAEATHSANASQSAFLASLVSEMLNGELEGKKVALWGLAFKPETDDVREAPSLKLTAWLLANGVKVVGHDPEAGTNFKIAVGDAVTVTDRDYDALNGADALVLLTEWRSYLAPDFHEIRDRMRGNVVVDARNVWRSVDVTAAGLRYQGIGTR